MREFLVKLEDNPETIQKVKKSIKMAMDQKHTSKEYGIYDEIMLRVKHAEKFPAFGYEILLTLQQSRLFEKTTGLAASELKNY